MLKVELKISQDKLQIHQGLSEEDCASQVQICSDLLSLMARKGTSVQCVHVDEEVLVTYEPNDNVQKGDRVTSSRLLRDSGATDSEP
ncbi:MAG: hypothetical protein AAGK05_14890 [Pseudomonadota bacterium]